MHLDLDLDLTVPDRNTQENHHARALELGAELRPDPMEDPEEPLFIYADPPGHSFCAFVA